MKSYTSKDVMAMIGIGSRQVTYWPQVGLIQPEIADGAGRQTKRVYSKRNLYEFWLVKKLYDSGFDLRAIKRLLPKFDLDRRDRQTARLSGGAWVRVRIPELPCG